MKHYPELEVIPDVLESCNNPKAQSIGHAIRVFNDEDSTPLEKAAVCICMLL